MAASPRDLLKPRSQRLMEVAQSIQQQNGFADGQFVTFGCVLAPGATDTELAISQGEVSIAQSLVEVPAQAGLLLTGAEVQGVIPTLVAGEACYVLVEVDATGDTFYLTPGATVTGGTPVMPAPTATRIVLGYLSLAGAFTPGTTALTAAMCITQPYSAGNVNPVAAGGF